MGRAIHFPLTPKGAQPEILVGESHFSSIPAIFAVHSTGQYDGDHSTIFQTDKASLDRLSNAARDASGEINDTVQVIAKLGANAKFRELDEWTTTSLMWTFNRLAELREALDQAATEFEYALQRGHYLRVNPGSYESEAESEGGHHD